MRFPKKLCFQRDELFICPECNHRRHGLPMYGYSVDQECPECGGVYDEAQMCPDCGEMFPESLGVRFEHKLYCPECRVECSRCDKVFYIEDTVENEEYRGRICMECSRTLEEAV
jgi:formylmethanofuran dehydrogenase subunit E